MPSHKKTLNLTFLLVFFFLAVVCSTSEAYQLTDLLSWQYPTDQEVVDLAVEKGFLKPDLSDEAVRGETATTWKVWISRNREDKKMLVRQAKDMFIEADHALIRKPDEHYVNEINIRIFNVLKENNVSYFSKIPFHTLFKSLAIIEGDYDDGRTEPLELIRNWFGEQGIEQMKENYPERYEALEKRQN